jgi:hypothetical protein
MSAEQPRPSYLWQGFSGPMDAAQAAYLAAQLDPHTGALLPLHGGPMALDEGAREGLFAVLALPDNLPPVPPGMEAASADMMLRLVGAG